ncbi:transmembrane protein 180-like [Lytechinus variegatus]|uniref:transmembrane protein 180-like n=1 Tax=Lytechinus variegatus TaxID=7654 RepID=UPI001BB1786D|nr:transmembrane protein 180-like [Lytechinus variegatus]
MNNDNLHSTHYIPVLHTQSQTEAITPYPNPRTVQTSERACPTYIQVNKTGVPFRMKNWVDRNAFAYSMTSLAAVLMNSIFRFYYVRLFTDYYHISESWFNVAQVVYMIWNAVNDPLFAYWQDNSNIKAFRSRRHAIMYGAPLFAICFLLPWFPWKTYEANEWIIGVHLTVSLCCYDALFTFVLLSHGALFAEISTRHEDRVRLTRYGQVASIVGSTSVLFSQFVSDNLNNFHAFQVWCVFVAFLSWAAMHYTGSNVRTRFELQPSGQGASGHLSMEKKSLSPSSQDGSLSLSYSQAKQIIFNRNFLIFVFINFCQIFHMNYGANFLAVFVTQLIPETDLSQFIRKALFGTTFILPQFLVLLLSIFVTRYGYYRIIVWSFYFKICSAIFMFLIGAQHTHIMVFFFIMDRSLPDAIFSFFNLCLSDIIDEDQLRNKRSSPLSSSVFGYNALFTKPASSLAPMMVVNILNRYSYQELQDEKLSLQHTTELKGTMFILACFIPIIIGSLQLLVWRNYTIRSSHISVAKHVE